MSAGKNKPAQVPVFSDEGEERYYLYMPVADRAGKPTKAPTLERIELWNKYKNMLQIQLKSVAILGLSGAGIAVVLPVPGVNILAVPFGFVFGHEFKNIIVQQEYKGIVFNRQNIAYPFLEG